MRKYFLLCNLILMLAGCIPCYHPPCVDVPCCWRIDADEGSTLCNLRWWEQFEDPVLNELITTALLNNQDLQVAIHRVFEYYARLGVTNSGFWPTVTGNIGFSRTEFSISQPIDPTPLSGTRIFNDYTAFLSANWELDFWGRIRGASEAASADLMSQVEARRAVVMTVVTSVVKGYIVLRQLDAQLQISKETLQSRLESLKLAKSRFELGETSEIEVKQEESEVEVAAIRVIEFERAIPQQENLLSVLLGENPHDIVRGIALKDFNYPCTIPAGLPSELLFRRPDIVEAEDKLMAADARITEARALFFPQISLTGLYGSESISLKQLFTNPAETWSYGFNIVQTLFDAGKIWYAWRATKEISQEALHTYYQTVLNAFREVDDALVETEKDRELVVEHKKQVKVLAEYLHLARLRYEEGEIDYLNVLDAERQLFNAELDLVASQADNFNAVVKLYSALGGGWVFDADMTALNNAMCP